MKVDETPAGSEVNRADQSYGQLATKKIQKSRSGFNRGEKKKPEKVAFVNTAMQKSFLTLRKTSKSRFDGVRKYFNGAFVSKQLPIPTFNAKKDVKNQDDQRSALLNGEDLTRNDSTDILMERIGVFQGHSQSNLRSANVEMSQLLKKEIHESKETVERVKRGHSIFDLEIVQEAQTQKQSVVLSKPGLSEQFEHFLDLSVAQTTYIGETDIDATRQFSDLIQNSPQKQMQRSMKARLVRNMKRRQENAASNQQAAASPYTMVGVHDSQSTKPSVMMMGHTPAINKSKNYSQLVAAGGSGGKSGPGAAMPSPQQHQVKHNSLILPKGSNNPDRHMQSSTRHQSSAMIPSNYRTSTSFMPNSEISKGTFQAYTDLDIQQHEYNTRSQPRNKASRGRINNYTVVREANHMREALEDAGEKMKIKMMSATGFGKFKTRKFSEPPSTSRQNSVAERGSSRLDQLKPNAIQILNQGQMGGGDGAPTATTKCKKKRLGSSMMINSAVSIDSEEEEELKKPSYFAPNVESNLHKEYNQFQRMFEIPINPAFFTSTNIRQPKKLQSLQSYLKDHGTASTHSHHRIYEAERIRIEHRLFKQGIEQILPGYIELEYMDRLCDFVRLIDLDALSDKEKELIDDPHLTLDPVSRRVKKFMTQFDKDWQVFLEEQAQQYLTRLTDLYKLRFGKEEFRQLLINGNLPTALLQNQNFEDHSKRLNGCKEHGKAPLENEIRECLTCQVFHKRIQVPDLDDDDEYRMSDRPKKSSIFVKKDTKQEDEERKKVEHEENKRRAIVKLRKEAEKMPIRTLNNPDGISLRQQKQELSFKQSDKVEAVHHNVISIDVDGASDSHVKGSQQHQKSHNHQQSKKGEPERLNQNSNFTVEDVFKCVNSEEDDLVTTLIREVWSEREDLRRQHEDRKRKLQATQAMEDSEDESPNETKINQKFKEQSETYNNQLDHLMKRRDCKLRFNDWLGKLEGSLYSLDFQVTNLTKGDLRAAKKNENKIKFDPSLIPSQMSQSFAEEKRRESDDGFDSSDEEEIEKKQLFKQCFNKKNIAVGRMIRTTETVMTKANKFKADLQKLLIRAKLDRPSMIQEKFRIIWKEQDGSAVQAAEAKSKKDLNMNASKAARQSIASKLNTSTDQLVDHQRGAAQSHGRRSELPGLGIKSKNTMKPSVALQASLKRSVTVKKNRKNTDLGNSVNNSIMSKSAKRGGTFNKGQVSFANTESNVKSSVFAKKQYGSGLTSSENADVCSVIREENSFQRGGGDQQQQQTSRNEKNARSRESKVKLMSIRDVLHDRQSRRLKDNELQKNGYRHMLAFLERRRKDNPGLDIQPQEVKMMNAVKILVESGWVVDRSYFRHICKISGLDELVAYYKSIVDENAKVDLQKRCILIFANRLAANLGMEGALDIHLVDVAPRPPKEVKYTLDPNLYLNDSKGETKADGDGFAKENDDDLARAVE